MKRQEEEVHKVLRSLGVCRKVRGTEEIPELVEMLRTSWGFEFCRANQYPSLQDWEKYKESFSDLQDVFLNAGLIHLKNPCNALLIGNTFAEIIYNGEQSYHLTLLNGAKAKVTAESYAVVAIENEIKEMMYH